MIAPSLRNCGHEVFAFDPTETSRLATRGTPQQQVAWIFDQFTPERIVVFSCDSSVDQLVEIECEARNIAKVLLCAEELCEPTNESIVVAAGTATNVISEATRSVAKYDVVVLGSASDHRAEIIRQVMHEGMSVSCVGSRWDRYTDIRSRATGPRALSFIDAELHRAKVCLVLSGTQEDPRVDIGPIHAALIAATAGVAVVAELSTGVGRYLKAGEIVAAESEELATTLRQLLDTPSILEQNAKAANTKVFSELTWESRWASLLGESSPRVEVRKDGPTVSYIWPMYNAEAFLADSIASVLNQTFTDLELVMYDDGSSDASVAVANRFASDPRVRISQGANVGQTGRFDFLLNELLRDARGDFIGLLGADDIAFPERTQRQMNVFSEDSTVDVVHTGGVQVNERNENQGPAFELDFSYDSSSMLRRLIRGNSVASPTVLMRRSIVERVGWSGGFATDYNLWMRAARVGRFRFLPECLTGYREHSTNTSLGAGLGESQRQALVTRLPERSLSSITDLFPALQYVSAAEATAWAAAFVDVGNGHIRYVNAPEAAIAEYEMALQIAPLQLHPIIRFNIAVAMGLGGDNASSQALINDVIRTSPEMAQYIVNNPSNVPVQAQLISEVPFKLPIEIARDTLCWDGTPASLKRILVMPNWARPDLLEATVHGYLSRFTSDDEIDLIIPTAGLDVESALRNVQKVLPEGIDMKSSAILTLEEWDDLNYIAMDRFQLVVNHFATSTPQQIAQLFSTI